MRSKRLIYNDIQRYSVLFIRSSAPRFLDKEKYNINKISISLSRINQLANLIHRVTISNLSDEYEDNDIDFINYGIRDFLESDIHKISLNLCFHLIEFIEACPEHLQDKIIWQPSSEFVNSIKNELDEFNEKYPPTRI